MAWKTFASGDVLTAAQLNSSVVGMSDGSSRNLLLAGSSVLTANGSGDASVTFATAFPTACDAISFGCGDNNAVGQQFARTAMSSTGFTVRMRTGDGTVLTTGQSGRLDWIAIGH